MSRPLRLEFEGAYYHVMNRAIRERRGLFEHAADHERFLRLLGDLGQRWQIKIYAYCLMGNHYHLFLQTPDGGLSRAIRHLDGLYAQYYNKTRRRDGPVFRGRFKAIIVDADSYLLQLVRYIHLNPVKARIVSDPAHYPWSSHRLYLEPSGPGLEWLDKEAALSFFDHDVRDYEEFVAQGNDKSLEAFYAKKRFAPFLGDDGFAARQLKRLPAGRAPSRIEATPQWPDLDALCRRVSAYFEVPIQALLSGSRGRLNCPRNLAIYIASREAGFPHREIQKVFRLGTPNAVGRVCERLEKGLGANPQWQVDLRNLMLQSSEMCQVGT